MNRIIKFIFILLLLPVSAEAFEILNISKPELFHRKPQSGDILFYQNYENRGELVSSFLQAFEVGLFHSFLAQDDSFYKGRPLFVGARFVVKRSFESFNEENLLKEKDLETLTQSAIEENHREEGVFSFTSAKPIFLNPDLTSTNYIFVSTLADLGGNSPIRGILALVPLNLDAGTMISFQQSTNFSAYFHKSQILTLYIEAGPGKTEILSLTVSYLRAEVSGFTRSIMFPQIQTDLTRIARISERLYD